MARLPSTDAKQEEARSSSEQTNTSFSNNNMLVLATVFVVSVEFSPLVLVPVAASASLRSIVLRMQNRRFKNLTIAESNFIFIYRSNLAR